MRRFLISLLLASAAASPALAQRTDGGRRFDADRQESRSEARAERQQAREQRSQAHEQQQPTETHGLSNDAPPQARSFGGNDSGHSNAMRIERSENQASGDSVRGWRGRQVEAESTTPTQSQNVQDAPRGPTNWRMHERHVGNVQPFGDRDGASHETAGQDAPTAGRRNIEWRRVPGTASGDLVQPDRPLPRVLRTRTPVVSDTPREGTQPPLRTDFRRRTADVHWDTSWRHNRRYDWWSWRRTHRNFFHLGFYYDPFGWDYRPYSIGWRLWPSYFSSRYWISNPWEYRLPYAPPGYRWIRYYDDALLVDTWDGEVVDVIYNFFW